MLRRRAPQVLIGTAIIGLGATALAAPAQADTTVTVTGEFNDPDGKEYFLSTSADAGVDPESVRDSTVTVVADITWGVEPPQLYVVNEALSNGGTDCLSDACPISVGPEGASFDVATWAGNRTVLVTTFAGTGGAEKRLKIQKDGVLSDVSFLLTYEAPPTPDPSPSDSAGSASTSSPTVQLQALDLFGDGALPAGESGLVGWEKAVPVNTWQALPQSEDVVGIGANEGKVFLGMATTPDFPVDIAQRQVDNGWGAYEVRGDDGEVESVFIPAGGSLFVNAQPRLYAVWGTA